MENVIPNSQTSSQNFDFKFKFKFLVTMCALLTLDPPPLGLSFLLSAQIALVIVTGS